MTNVTTQDPPLALPTALTESEIEHFYEFSKLDNAIIVGSDIRRLCAQALLALTLSAKLKQAEEARAAVRGAAFNTAERNDILQHSLDAAKTRAEQAESDLAIARAEGEKDRGDALPFRPKNIPLEVPHGFCVITFQGRHYIFPYDEKGDTGWTEITLKAGEMCESFSWRPSGVTFRRTHTRVVGKDTPPDDLIDAAIGVNKNDD